MIAMHPRSREGWLSPGACPAAILVRLMAGLVFFFEGVLKFHDPAGLGAGRFARIGIPVPEIMGPFVGGVETLCGALLVLGLLTRPAALPLLVDISVAILSTKVPILLGHGFWGFAAPGTGHAGFLAMMHEARTDLCMFLALVFLLVAGPGRWSLDVCFTKRPPDE